MTTLPSLYHSFSFQDQPVLSIPRIHMLYEWDFTKGKIPFNALTPQHVLDTVLAYLESPAWKVEPTELCIDLEPHLSPRYLSFSTVLPNISYLNNLFSLLKDHPDLPPIHRFGLGLQHDIYRTNQKRLLDIEVDRFLSTYLDPGPSLSLPIYRPASPTGDPNFLSSSIFNIRDATDIAKRHNLPLHVWCSSYRNGPTQTPLSSNDYAFDLSLFYTNLATTSNHTSIPTALVLWEPPTLQTPSGNYVPKPWSSKDPAIITAHTTLLNLANIPLLPPSLLPST